MKKKLIPLIFLLSITSCIFERNNNAEKLINQNININPNWLLEPEIYGSFFAIGNANNKIESFNIKVKTAEFDGRKKVIQQINKKLLSTLNKSLLDISFNDKDKSLLLLENSIKNTINHFDQLAIKRNDVFLDKENNLHIHMSVKKSIVENHFKKNKKIIMKNIKDSILSDNDKKNLEIALEEFYSELCKL